MNTKSREFILQKQLCERESFYECVRKDDFSQLPIEKKGHYDWTKETYNIKKGNKPCPNDCKYCYIKAMNIRMKKEVEEVGDIENAHEMKCESAPQKVNKTWRKADSAEKKYIMMPSSHDIFNDNVEDICIVANKMIIAGHDVLIVTKARLSCINFMVNYFKQHPRNEEIIKQHIEFRITIGSFDNQDIRFWEGNSPLFEERFECVKLLYHHGYNVSVSAEPLLTLDPMKLYKMLEPYISCIWFGEMNYVPILIEMKTEEDKEYLAKLDTITKNLKTYVRELMKYDKVFWKKGIRNYLKESQIG